MTSQHTRKASQKKNMPSWRNCVPNRRNFDDHRPEIESPYCPAIDWWDRHGPTHLMSLKHVEIISCQPQTNKARGKQEKWYHLPQKMGPKQLGYLWILDWHCLQGNWWWIPQREVAEGGIQKSLFQCSNTGSRKRMEKGQVAPIHQFHQVLHRWRIRMFIFVDDLFFNLAQLWYIQRQQVRAVQDDE